MGNTLGELLKSGIIIPLSLRAENYSFSEHQCSCAGLPEGRDELCDLKLVVSSPVINYVKEPPVDTIETETALSSRGKN